MRGWFILILGLAAAACASKSQTPLAAFVGAPQQIALDTLGEPLHQRKDGTLTRSHWRVSFASMTPVRGRDGPTPPVCEVFLAVDPQGVIASAQMRGDKAACARWHAPLELAEKIQSIRCETLECGQ